MIKRLLPLWIVLAVYVVLGIILYFEFLRPSPDLGPPVIAEVLDPSLQRFAPAWQAEAGRRFDHAVIVLCHGGNFIGNEWIVNATAYGRYTTAQDVARFEKAKYPGRTIILLCCNPGHLDLGISGVYFFGDSVWCLPDRAIGDNPQDARLKLDTGYDPAMSRWSEEPGICGNIFEAIRD